MRAIKQNIPSTKKKNNSFTVKTEGGKEYTIPFKKYNDIYVSVDDAQETMYIHQTGTFPTRSIKGNRYIMILCEKENNIILNEAMKTEQQEKLYKLNSFWWSDLRLRESNQNIMFLEMIFLKILDKQ